jgi:hypothetical protein
MMPTASDTHNAGKEHLGLSGSPKKEETKDDEPPSLLQMIVEEVLQMTVEKLVAMDTTPIDNLSTTTQLRAAIARLSVVPRCRLASGSHPGNMYDQLTHDRACAHLSRANNLGIYSCPPVRFTNADSIPDVCDWCEQTCQAEGPPIFQGYYYNTPTEECMLCNDCGKRVITTNEDDDIVFCYMLD